MIKKSSGRDEEVPEEGEISKRQSARVAMRTGEQRRWEGESGIDGFPAVYMLTSWRWPLQAVLVRQLTLREGAVRAEPRDFFFGTSKGNANVVDRSADGRIDESQSSNCIGMAGSKRVYVMLGFLLLRSVLRDLTLFPEFLFKYKGAANSCVANRQASK